MAELDYAFLADYAKAEPNGTLTVVGASWTHLSADRFPSFHRMSVAGRVHAQADEPAVSVTIQLIGPEGSFKLGTELDLDPSRVDRTYGDGRVGLLFALDMQVPLPASGLYQVLVTVGQHAPRRLAFEATEG